MAQNAAFLSYGATAAVSTAPTLITVTVGTAATGLPATAIRVWNNGTAAAFIFIGTGVTMTTTGAAANGMPVPQSVAPYVLRTGGVSTVQLQTTGTNTTTIFVTGGEGIS